MTSAEYQRLNRRRGELIDKKYHCPVDHLTPEESDELADLQQKCGDYVDLHFPLPSIPEDVAAYIENMGSR